MLRMPVFKLSMAFLFAFQPAMSFANTAEQKQFQYFVAHPLSIEENIFALAMLGTSTESLKTIYADMQKRIGNRAPTKNITVSGAKVLVDGKASGLSIVSYSPLNLEYRGKSWLFDKSKPFEANYFSMTKFLDGNQIRSASIFSFLISPAFAQSMNEDRSKLARTFSYLGAGLLGGIIGLTVAGTCFVSGGAACVLYGLLGCLGGAAGGGAIGGGIGTIAGHGLAKRNQAASINRLNALLSTKDPVQCDSTKMTIGPIKGSKVMITVNKVKNTIEVSNADGGSENYYPDDVKARLQGLAAACGSASEAAALNHQIATGATAAKLIVSGSPASVSNPEDALAPSDANP